MKIDITFIGADKERYKKSRTEYLETFKRLMRLRASLKTHASKPFLATNVELILSAGRKINEVPYDPKVTPKLMVGIETFAVHPWKDRKDDSVTIGGPNINKNYFTAIRTYYYRINPDGTFLHRKGQPSMKSLFHNYDELTQAISELLKKL